MKIVLLSNCKGKFVQLVQAVPNFSTGDIVKAGLIAACFKNRKNVALLNYTADVDHNRCVVTAAGEPSALREALSDVAQYALAANGVV